MMRKHTKFELSATERLTQEEFKALAKFKGWTYRAIAERWEITPEYLGAIARNVDRSLRFDDMLRGLPNLNRIKAEQRRQSSQLSAAMAARKQNAPKASQPARPQTPGYRYHDYLYIGAIVTASTEVGSLAEEGARGAVFSVTDDGVQETYGVIFESGLWDWFTPVFVDACLSTTGLDMAGMMSYSYIDDTQLQTDFDQGKFDFWPVVPLLG